MSLRTRNFLQIVIIWQATIISSLAQEPQFNADAIGFQKRAIPFLKTYCSKCHSDGQTKGDFSFERDLANDFGNPASVVRWKQVVELLNSHEMPPAKATQPKADETAQFVDWVTEQSVRAELSNRSRKVVLRRLNRNEYRNTIRDLLHIDFDVSGFPQDPAAGGFDNNGGTLSMSPFQMELYLNTARQIVDRALVEGKHPEKILWHFAPIASPDIDRRRVRFDAKNNAILNGGNNQQEDGYVVVRSDSWDRGVNARDFRVPTEGIYAVRLHGWGRIPRRDEIVEGARKILEDRKNGQDKSNPKQATNHQKQFDIDLKHFQTDRMYDYSPPRIKLVQHLGPQPRTIAEFDMDGTAAAPKTHEFLVRFTTESAGINWDYAYSIPKVLENFWLQNRDVFPRPEARMDWFEIEGPIYPSWPPPSHKSILFDSPTKSKDMSLYAREVIERFMRKAYRRPVTSQEVDAKHAVFIREWKGSTRFIEALKIPLISILTSPNFLFLVEPLSSESRLTNHEFATRLSYFLWSSSPDRELSEHADLGDLSIPKILHAQVERMLDDPRSKSLAEDFAAQWLGLREVGANPPASDLFPQYDRHLETSIVGESQAFFHTIIKEDLSVLNFVKSDFIAINERLARFYGIDGVRGDHFRKVWLKPDSHRGGIVTQASMLTITSNGTRTSPVKRGVWILKNLLGTDPGLPVANVGEIAPKVPGIDKATVRDRLQAHRSLEQCARCHSKIDPLGFALENFNASGEWRDQEGFGYKGRINSDDPKIDASSQMPDGTKINGADGLREALLAREDLFLRCFTTKLLTYALGRELGLSDQPTVEAGVKTLKQSQYRMRSLIHFIVETDVFLAR